MSTIILSCTTMLESVARAQEVCGTSYEVIELDRTYHAEPEQMREHIISTIESLPKYVNTILVAMGFCGGSWQDVLCEKRTILPRVADCVAMTLVTENNYDSDLKLPGHMYLFGEGDNGFSINSVYESLLEEHGKEKAEQIFDMYFEHYHNVDIVDNGLYDCYDFEYVERAQAEADKIHAELDFVEGSNILLEQLVSGKWDEKFVVFQAGETITQGKFYSI